MPTIDIPFLGNLILCGTLVACAYTFLVAVRGAQGSGTMVASARYGTYATAAFVLLAVCLLAYAFQTHDFRIRYVARYSDRSMSWWYLVSSLWGGQDGSLLWWAFLLCGYTVAVTHWMRDRYRELLPWVIATLMVILGFFILLMLFAANPFATYVAQAPADGEGLNPLLQNYWMTIHPPSLYLGFVGWSVPFAIAIAALISGRLHNEWIQAARKWAVIAWLFLSIGLVLGMLWSYEELGWGGYWAWDPVENASFMPWLVGTAYVHSVMTQERLGMLKVWNVFLICLTFFMTIFGTFLTRSGMIASVHSFARSDIGVWFVWFMVVIVLVCAALMIWRLDRLKGEHRIRSLASREFGFLLNNWILLAMMLIVLVLTTYPLITEFVEGEQATVGPAVYNAFLIPFGIVLLFLMGVGPLLAWRKATGKNLGRALLGPGVAGVACGIIHLAIGPMLDMPAIVDAEPIFDTGTGDILASFSGISPLLVSIFSGFTTGTIVQEFWRGIRLRMRKGEGVVTATTTLVGRARRRYGGYIVHLGIVLMYVGFAGAAYDEEHEDTLSPGESMEVGDYRIRYDDVRMESDRNKRMIFTDLTVLDAEGSELGEASPGKFIYRTMQEQPTTEVAIRSRPLGDIYLIMSRVEPETGRGTFRVVLRPLVFWIWFGGFILVFGTVIAIFPSVRQLLAEGGRSRRRASKIATMALTLVLAIFAFVLISAWPPNAQAQDESSSLHAGTVVINNPVERRVFQRMLCRCGQCPRLPMDQCGCGWAEERRAMVRERLAAGDEIPEILEDYRDEFGVGSIAVPPDEGLGRAMWVVPVVLTVLGLFGVFSLGRRWRRRDEAGESQEADEEISLQGGDDVDELAARLEDELEELERED